MQTLTINEITKPYKHWAGTVNPLTGSPATIEGIQNRLRRRRAGELLTDIECLWGKKDCPQEWMLLEHGEGSYQGFVSDVMQSIDQLFVKHFGEMAKYPKTKSKPQIIPYNPYWSRLPKKEDVDRLTNTEVNNLPNEFHFFCLNAEDLTNLLSLTQYYFEGGYEHLYDLLQSKAIVKRFKLKDPLSFQTWNTLVQLSNLTYDINVMALNKDKIVNLALELELNPAILPDLQCSPQNFPTPEQSEWWEILGEDIKLYPVSSTDLIN